MTYAIRIHETGGPDVLTWESIEISSPGPRQALIRQTASGLNYIDVYHRSGLYPVPAMPAVIGSEGVGVVEAIGDNVSEVDVGDRVAYCMNIGSYAQWRLIPSRVLVRVPQTLTDAQAAAIMLKGCTVQYLLRQTYPIQAGQTILFHAAAGGCGLIACQWAKHLGAIVIGTVSTPEKAELAEAHGCDHTIVYTQENFVERVKELTDGQGVPVVYDSVGKDTFLDSLDCLQPRGMMVNFGNASGAADPLSPGVLAAKGSLYLTRPTLATYARTPAEVKKMTDDLFNVVSVGAVSVEVNQMYQLENVAQAHRDLESRKTTGSTVLLTGA